MGDRDLSRDEEVVELTRRFKKFLMENKERYGNVWGEVTSAKVQKISGVDKSGRHVTICSLCYEEGHKRVDCPENDNLFVGASNVVKWGISRWIARMQNQMEMLS